MYCMKMGRVSELKITIKSVKSNNSTDFFREIRIMKKSNIYPIFSIPEIKLTKTIGYYLHKIDSILYFIIN